MPLWVVFHPPGTFQDNTSKQALSKDITTIYTGIGLPAFYVVVEFIEMPVGSTWIGGEIPEKPFVRLVVDHIAVRMDNADETYKACTAKVEEILKPHIKDRDYDYEYHIDETERRLWRVNGFIPPLFGSEGEKLWFRLNRPVSYDLDAKNGAEAQIGEKL